MSNQRNMDEEQLEGQVLDTCGAMKMSRSSSISSAGSYVVVYTPTSTPPRSPSPAFIPSSSTTNFQDTPMILTALPQTPDCRTEIPSATSQASQIYQIYKSNLVPESLGSKAHHTNCAQCQVSMVTRRAGSEISCISCISRIRLAAIEAVGHHSSVSETKPAMSEQHRPIYNPGFLASTQRDISASNNTVCKDEIFQLSNELGNKNKSLRLNELTRVLKICDARVTASATTQPKSTSQSLQAGVGEYVNKEDEGKFRCRVTNCAKLFKSEHFWMKHMQNRHQSILVEVQKMPASTEHIDTTEDDQQTSQGPLDVTHDLDFSSLVKESLTDVQTTDVALKEDDCEIRKLLNMVKDEVKEVQHLAVSRPHIDFSQIQNGLNLLETGLEERASICCGSPVDAHISKDAEEHQTREFVLQHFKNRLQELQCIRDGLHESSTHPPLPDNSHASPPMPSSLTEYISGLKSLAGDASRFAMVYPEQKGYSELCNLVSKEIEAVTILPNTDERKVGFTKHYEIQLSQQKAATTKYRKTGNLKEISPGPRVRIYGESWRQGLRPDEGLQPRPVPEKDHQEVQVLHDDLRRIELELKMVMVDSFRPDRDQIQEDIHNCVLGVEDALKADKDLFRYAKERETIVEHWRTLVANMQNNVDSVAASMDFTKALSELPDFRYLEIKRKVAVLSMLRFKVKAFADKYPIQTNFIHIYRCLCSEIDSRLQSRYEELDLIRKDLLVKDLRDSICHYEMQVEKEEKITKRWCKRQQRQIFALRAGLDSEIFERRRKEEKSSRLREREGNLPVIDDIGVSTSISSPFERHDINNPLSHYYSISSEFDTAGDTSPTSSSDEKLGNVKLGTEQSQDTPQIYEKSNFELESRVRELEDQLLNETWKNDARVKDFEKEILNLTRKNAVLSEESSRMAAINLDAETKGAKPFTRSSDSQHKYVIKKFGDFLTNGQCTLRLDSLAEGDFELISNANNRRAVSASERGVEDSKKDCRNIVAKVESNDITSQQILENQNTQLVSELAELKAEVAKRDGEISLLKKTIKDLKGDEADLVPPIHPSSNDLRYMIQELEKLQSRLLKTDKTLRQLEAFGTHRRLSSTSLSGNFARS